LGGAPELHAVQPGWDTHDKPDPVPSTPLGHTMLLSPSVALHVMQ
tara:strand:+ start:784 stop:918 length:135 start_codon:yes stop_codon:yes gene_type:complete